MVIFLPNVQIHCILWCFLLLHIDDIADMNRRRFGAQKGPKRGPAKGPLRAPFRPPARLVGSRMVRAWIGVHSGPVAGGGGQTGAKRNPGTLPQNGPKEGPTDKIGRAWFAHSFLRWFFFPRMVRAWFCSQIIAKPKIAFQ